MSTDRVYTDIKFLSKHWPTTTCYSNYSPNFLKFCQTSQSHLVPINSWIIEESKFAQATMKYFWLLGQRLQTEPRWPQPNSPSLGGAVNLAAKVESSGVRWGEGKGRGLPVSSCLLTSHRTSLHITLSLKTATAERTSYSDGAETDGSEINHQSLRERQGRSHLSLHANRWQTT